MIFDDFVSKLGKKYEMIKLICDLPEYNNKKMLDSTLNIQSIYTSIV